MPVHLLIWAVQSFVTTLTSLLEVWDWTDRTIGQKRDITMLYGPYVAFGMCFPSYKALSPRAVCGNDMFLCLCLALILSFRSFILIYIPICCSFLLSHLREIVD